jgi:lysophospholipase L1-like esterase
MDITNRRRFLQNAVIGTMGLSAIPSVLAATEKRHDQQNKKSKGISLKIDDIILFQGDSITDAGRDKASMDPNNQKVLGGGYAFLTAAELLNCKATLNLKIHNKGISGNKVFQLAERWQADCIDIKPNVLSILIGVNDFWHKLNNKYDGTIEVYEKDFRALLNITKLTLPDTKLVIGEPFAVLGCKAVDEKWFPEFDVYRAVAKNLANEFNAIFIPFHTIFEEAAKVAPATYWTGDGVHPSIAGAKLMSAAWIKAVIGE